MKFQKLIAFFKNLLPSKKSEPQAEVPVKTPDIVVNPAPDALPAHYIKALNEVGQREIKGNAHNPRIIEYHSATDLKASQDEVSWCAAFVNWCLRETHQKGTNKANARSFLDWGNIVTVPKKGDVVVFWRVSKNGWQGHVGFFVEESKNTILVLGGNQGDEVNFSHYPKSQLLGYRRINA